MLTFLSRFRDPVKRRAIKQQIRTGNWKPGTGNPSFRYNTFLFLRFCKVIGSPMNISTHSNLDSVRHSLACLWGFLCILTVLAPILSAHSLHIISAAVYIFFSSICHQMPERSFFLSGHSLAVCHRCSGIYFGLFLGSLLKISVLHRSHRRRRICLIAAISLLSLDALMPYTGLYQSSALTRFATGLLFGTIGSSILARGVSEFLQEFSWRRFRSSLWISKEALDE
jgi:uncharacterized membrane protein